MRSQGKHIPLHEAGYSRAQFLRKLYTQYSILATSGKLYITDPICHLRYYKDTGMDAYLRSLSMHELLCFNSYKCAA